MRDFGADGAGRRRAMVVGACVAGVALVIGLIAWRVAAGGDDRLDVAGEPVVAMSPTTATTTATTVDPGTTVAEPPPSTEAPPPNTTAAPRPTTTARTPVANAPPPPAPRIPRVAIVGDSTAESLARGLASWGQTTGRLTSVGNGARLGCPIGRTGKLHTAADAIGDANPFCDWQNVDAPSLDKTVRPSYPNLVAQWKPDLVVVDSGGWDAADRMLPGESQWRHLGDPVLDNWLLDEMTLATDLLSSGGAEVVWLTQPPWEGATRHPPPTLYEPATDPARMRRYNELLHELAARRPGAVRIVDLAGWIASTGEDARLRPDGAHFEADTAIEVMQRYLGDELVRVAA